MCKVKWKHLFTSILFTGFVVLCITACTGKLERQERYYAKAKELFSVGDLVKSSIEVRNALQIDGNHPGARFLLAQIHEKNSDWHEMYDNLRLVIELDPNHVDARIKLAYFYYANEAYAEVLEQADQVLAIEPEEPDAHTLRGYVFLKKGELDQAIREANIALSSDSSHVPAISLLSQVYKGQDPGRALAILDNELKNKKNQVALMLMKIDVLESTGEVEQAINGFHEIITENPDNLLLRYRLVKLLEKYNRIDEAEHVIRKIVEINPENIKLKLWLVDFLSRMEDKSSVKETLSRFIQEYPERVEFQFALGEVQLALEEYGEVKKIYRKILREHESTADALTARNRLVDLALTQNDRPEADRLLAEIFALDPENPEALIIHAKLLMTDSDFDAAIADLRTAIKKQSKPIEALYLLAQAHERIGATRLAIDNYKQLLTLDPDNSKALSGAGELMVTLGQDEEAERFLKFAHNIDPENSDITQSLISLYAKQKRFEEGLLQAERLIGKSETKSLGIYLKAKLNRAQNKFDEAIEGFKRTLAIESRAIEALQGLVEAYQAKNEIKAASSYLKKHILEFPDHAHAYRLLSELNLKTDPQSSIKILQQGIKANPNQITLYENLGQIYAYMNQSILALDVFKKALDIDPSNVDIMILVADQLKNMQKYPEAEEEYQKALLLNPNSQIASNNLAMLYIEHLENPSNLEKARELSKNLMGSKNVDFIDTLGLIHYKLGHYEEAIEYYKSAIALSQGDDALFRERLALAYSKIGADNSH